MMMDSLLLLEQQGFFTTYEILQSYTSSYWYSYCSTVSSTPLAFPLRRSTTRRPARDDETDRRGCQRRAQRFIKGFYPRNSGTVENRRRFDFPYSPFTLFPTFRAENSSTSHYPRIATVSYFLEMPTGST